MSNQASLGDISTSGGSKSDFEEESRKNLETKEESFFWKNVPEEWSLVDGTKIFEVNPSYDAEGEITYIGMDNLQTELPYPSIEGIRNADDYSGKLFTEDDVIFPRITPCTENGKRAIIEDIDTEYGIGSTEFIVLSPDQDKLVPWYLFYLVNSYVVRDYAISRMRGSTGRQRVPYSVFRNELDVALPPKDEQRRIASVLYNVDQAISKTEEIIEQTQRVKKGLMQDLFFSNSNADKEVQLNFTTAEVPQNWKKIQIGEIAKVKGRIGWRGYTKEDLRGDGPLVLGAGEINDRQKLELNETTHLSEEKYQESPEIMVEKGHIVLVQRGSLGKVALVDRDLGKCTINPSMILLKEIDIDQEFLYYLLCTEYIQGLIETHNSQTGVPMISQSAVENFNILKPPMAEQKEIAKKLRAVDDKIEKEIKEKEQLQRLKKGLMQDLLTGSVRTGEDVRVLDEVVEVES